MKSLHIAGVFAMLLSVGYAADFYQINIGNAPDDRNGETLRSLGGKVNTNFARVNATKLENSNAVAFGLSVSNLTLAGIPTNRIPITGPGSNLVGAAIGDGLVFDGTTLTATGSGAATNAISKSNGAGTNTLLVDMVAASFPLSGGLSVTGAAPFLTIDSTTAGQRITADPVAQALTFHGSSASLKLNNANYLGLSATTLQPASSDNIALGDATHLFSGIHVGTVGARFYDSDAGNYFRWVGTDNQMSANVSVVTPETNGLAGQVLTVGSASGGAQYSYWTTPASGSASTNNTTMANGSTTTGSLVTTNSFLSTVTNLGNATLGALDVRGPRMAWYDGTNGTVHLTNTGPSGFAYSITLSTHGNSSSLVITSASSMRIDWGSSGGFRYKAGVTNDYILKWTGNNWVGIPCRDILTGDGANVQSNSPSITDLRLPGHNATAGYVWTVTNVNGQGEWRLPSGGGGGAPTPAFFPPTNGFRIIWESTSQMAGTIEATNMATFFTNNFTTNYASYIKGMINMSANGDTATNSMNNYTNDIQVWKPAGGTNALLVYWIGINNIAADSTAWNIANASNFLAWAMRDGFTVVCVTPESASAFDGRSDYKDKRNELANWMRSSPRLWHYLLDFGQLMPSYIGHTSDGVHILPETHLDNAGELFGLLHTPPRSGRHNPWMQTFEPNMFAYVYRGLLIAPNIINADYGTLVLEDATGGGAAMVGQYGDQLGFYTVPDTGNFTSVPQMALTQGLVTINTNTAITGKATFSRSDERLTNGLAYATTVAVPMDGPAVQTITATGDIALNTTNRPTSLARLVRLYITASGGARTVTPNTNWKIFGTNATTYVVASGKTIRLDITAAHTAETDVFTELVNQGN